MDQSLLDAFVATEADLAVNRRGELTDRQRRRLRRDVDEDAAWMLGIALVLGVVMYGIGGYLFHDGRVFEVRDGSDALGVAGIVFGTVLLPTAGIGWAGYTAWIAAKARGPLTVIALEGEVSTRRIAYKQSEVFELVVAGRRLGLSQAAFEALVPGGRYRVFVVPEIDAVLAAEPLEGVTT